MSEEDYLGKPIRIIYANPKLIEASQRIMQEMYDKEQLAKTQTPKPKGLIGLVKKLFH